MFMKMIVKAETDEEFARALRKRMVTWLIVAACGALVLALALWLTPKGSGNDFYGGFLAGPGAGMLWAGAVLAIRTRRILMDRERLHRERLKETDERSQMIRGRAFQMGGVIAVIFTYVAVVINCLGQADMEIVKWLVGVIGVYAVGVGVSFIIFEKTN